VMKAILIILAAMAALFGRAESLSTAQPAHAAPGISFASTYFSPAALAIRGDGRTLYVAGATANQLISYDPARKEIVQRMELPASPSGIALSADDSLLYVTCAAPESRVCVIEANSGKLLASIRCGHTAMAPVLSRDGKSLFVCCRFEDAVAVIDLEQRKEACRIPVEREPVAAALTPDGSLLFVANHLHTGPADVGVVAASVTVIDTVTRKVRKHIPLTNGSGLLRGICVSPDGRYVAVAHTLARFHLPTTQVDHGWMNDNALTLLDTAELKVVNTVLLDDIDRGAANPWAVAWTRDGRSIVATHAGTHELSVIDAPALLAKLLALPTRVDTPAPADYLASRTVSDVPNDLGFLVGLRHRLKLPGNGPRALVLSDDKAYVALYFSDSLAAVDLSAAGAKALVAKEDLNSLALSAAPEPPPNSARRGELLFNDGTLCFQGWQSCASCHSSDGRVDGMDWDLLNDGIGNPKNVKSLLLSFQTPPVMSMGVRADAAAAVRAGIRYILFASPPEEVAVSIDEYIRNLKPAPSPHLVRGRLSAAAQRGRKLFSDPKVGCASCHRPPLYTDLQPHNIGAGKFDRPNDLFYTPSLIELWRTAPYLHDGSAATVTEAITTHNQQNLRGRTSQLSPEQISDLVEFLLSL